MPSSRATRSTGQPCFEVAPTQVAQQVARNAELGRRAGPPAAAGPAFWCESGSARCARRFGGGTEGARCPPAARRATARGAAHCGHRLARRRARRAAGCCPRTGPARAPDDGRAPLGAQRRAAAQPEALPVRAEGWPSCTARGSRSAWLGSAELAGRAVRRVGPPVASSPPSDVLVRPPNGVRLPSPYFAFRESLVAVHHTDHQAAF
jgi:hypothetical protein